MLLAICLWSKNQTALFGLVSHGIVRIEVTAEDGSRSVTWKMQEKLCGAVPCSRDRHTGKFIGDISAESWRAAGIENPIEQLSARVSDNGSNMMKGWSDGFQTPCADHTMELSVKVFTEHEQIRQTLEKGRGLVGYFNSSVIGNKEETVGLRACQKSAGVPENSLIQDVKTRWRSCHDMCNSLCINQEPLLLYDVRNSTAAKGFKDNRYSLEDWQINNQAVALLTPLATASQFLEGKTYPTSNLVLPSIYGCLAHLKPESAIRQPWDGKTLLPEDMRPEVQEARQALYDDMLQRWRTNMSDQLRKFYCVATLCDPRHKSLHFPGMTANEKVEAREWFVAEFDSLWSSRNEFDGAGVGLQEAAVREKKNWSHSQHSGASFIDFMAGMAHHLQAEDDEAGEDEVEPEKSEAQLYLDQPAVPLNTDVLQWWAAHEKTYPSLSRMARQFLGVPATSASAERLFSIAGRLYDDLRQKMKDDMLESLMFARVNRDNRLQRNPAISRVMDSPDESAPE
ncbi:hypothetical protein AB1Y20_010522 [Prymnesium parvum]|uniref:HAT C-terminal dimerisation domain-containing protein n=1 Tax=Prymnesium parvum TaxID=97485 RepID=A0AB34IPY5_PRYPA